MNERQLLKLKERIDSTAEEANRLEGQKQYLYEQLKSQHGLDTVEAAEEVLQSLEDELQELEANLSQSMQEIGDKYDVS